jgi:hypothetical protein
MRIKHFLSLLLIAGLVTIYSCENQSEENNPPPVLSLPETVILAEDAMNIFKVDYEKFITSLSGSDQQFLMDLVDSYTLTIDSFPGGRMSGASCSCGPGQSTCVATGVFSDCCICWSPTTHDGVCGSYFGISFCRTESKIPDTNPCQDPPCLNEFAARLDLQETITVRPALMYRALVELHNHSGVDITDIGIALHKLSN